MILTGFIAIIFIAILKAIHFDNYIFPKTFIIGLFIPNFDYCINTLFLSYSESLNSFSVFHSIFLGLIILALFYAYSEYKGNWDYKIIGKGLFFGIATHNLISILLSPIPFNQFWPIYDKDLIFSLLNDIVINNNQHKIFSYFFISNFLFLIIYFKFLIYQLVNSKASAIQIFRLSKSLKVCKYLLLFLLIFFVAYIVNFLAFNIFSLLFSICYLISLIIGIYITFKTDFKFINE